MNAEPAATPTQATENLLGRRIVAGIIDLVVLFIIFFIIGLLFGDSDTSGDGASFELSGLPALLGFVVAFGYYFVMEATSGQTLGKKVMGIKVVALDGPFSWGKSAIRTILRIVDGFFFYVVAVIVIAISKRGQRIGDMAAGTIVVRA
jgi:uncharacterized RDD family membrane protein YckC